MECVESGAFSQHDATDGPARTIPFSGRNISRTQASVRRARRNGRHDRWINAWGQLSNAIRNVAGVDLDFAEDDQELNGYRELQQFSNIEWSRWEQRLHIARRQGAGQIFRAAAPQVIRERIPSPAPVVETRAERQAWGAMERAQGLENSSHNRRKRRRSTTASPASHGSSTPEEPERKQKRPRTRIVQNGSSSGASSSTNAQPRPQSSRSNGSPRQSPRPLNTVNTNPEPTFLSSLLREVEMAPSSDEDSLRFGLDFTSSRANGATSPSLDYSSPATSPASPASSFRSREISTTPPPRGRQSRSPPLSTTIMPDFSAVNYSPNHSQPSPSDSMNRAAANQNKRNRDGSPTPEIRQPQPRRQKVCRARSQDSSPVRTNIAQSGSSRSENTSPLRNTMSIEEKQSISKIVKTALGPHWKSQKISEQQYSDINRNVSRKLYEMIADKNISEGDKKSWERIATSEVSKAVQSLTN